MAFENMQALIDKYAAQNSLSQTPATAAQSATPDQRAQIMEAVGKLFGSDKKAPQTPDAMTANVPTATGGFNQRMPAQDRGQLLQAMVARARNPGGTNGP